MSGLSRHLRHRNEHEPLIEYAKEMLRVIRALELEAKQLRERIRTEYDQRDDKARILASRLDAAIRSTLDP